VVMQCFDAELEAMLLDRAPFKLSHKLLGHPALTLENLGAVLPKLPKRQVMFSNSKLQNGDDFEATFRKRPKEVSIDETIEQIRTSNAYIMVSRPETDDSFKDLRNALVDDLRGILRSHGLGSEPIDPHLYLFIASPNSITPFHIDRYSTLLMQFRGSKTIHVYEQWDDRVVSQIDREAYVAYARTKLPWSAEIDALGHSFHFSPGETLHIPFIAGHHVRNGPDDVSISMSIIFNTEQSIRWRRALAFNYEVRKRIGAIPAGLSKVGRSRVLDGTKAAMMRAIERRRTLAER